MKCLGDGASSGDMRSCVQGLFLVLWVFFGVLVQRVEIKGGCVVVVIIGMWLEEEYIYLQIYIYTLQLVMWSISADFAWCALSCIDQKQTLCLTTLNS